MKKEFELQYMQDFPLPADFMIYVEAWLAYHRAVNEADNRLPYWKLSGQNVRPIMNGLQAMEDVLLLHGLQKPKSNNRVWQEAKREALRILEKEKKA